MKGIVGREIRYVSVVSETSPDGLVTPLQIVWDARKRYRVDEVLDRRQALSRKTGCAGMRYTVRIGDNVTYLWYEGPRWFVEAKVTSVPE